MRGDRFRWHGGPSLIFRGLDSGVLASFGPNVLATVLQDGIGQLWLDVFKRPPPPWNVIAPSDLLGLAESEVFRQRVRLRLLGTQLEIDAGPMSSMLFSLEMRQPEGAIEGMWEMTAYSPKAKPRAFGTPRTPLSITFGGDGGFGLKGFVNASGGTYSATNQTLNIRCGSWTLVGGSQDPLDGDTWLQGLLCSSLQFEVAQRKLKLTGTQRSAEFVRPDPAKIGSLYPLTN